MNILTHYVYLVRLVYLKNTRMTLKKVFEVLSEKNHRLVALQ